MATKIAHIIQGKNSPHYRPNKVEPNTDRCIILNAKNVYLTGNKLDEKMYRHHSGINYFINFTSFLIYYYRNSN